MRTQPIKTFIQFLIFSHLYLAGVVTAFYWGNKFIFTGTFKPNNYSLFVFFSTLFLYNVHRIYGLNKQSGKQPLRYEWAGKNLKLIYLLLFVSGVLAAFFANQTIQPHSFLLLACISVISFSYTFPIIPTANGLIRLKDIPLLKPIFISLMVVFVTVVLPQYNLIGSFTFATKLSVAICFAQFLFILSLTLLFDIRDIEQDKENNIRTLPVVYGVKKTQLASYICMLFYLLVFVLMYLNKNIIAQNFSAIFIAGILSCLIIYSSEKFKHPIWYMVAADGMLAAQLVILIAWY